MAKAGFKGNWLRLIFALEPRLTGNILTIRSVGVHSAFTLSANIFCLSYDRVSAPIETCSNSTYNLNGTNDLSLSNFPHTTCFKTHGAPFHGEKRFVTATKKLLNQQI